MDLNFNLKLTQQQKLVMTQQMQLSVKLLQMSNLELTEYIQKEIQENPTIEADFSNVEMSGNDDKIDYKKLSDYLESNNYKGETSYKEERVSPFNFIAEKKSLKDFLKEEIWELNENDYMKTVCKYIVECINEKGYFDDKIEDVSNVLKVDKIKAQRALEIVQSLDPCGIGARNLQECLMIQAHRKDILDENLKIIIENYLESIGLNKYNNIAKKLNISVKKAQEYGDIIKSLEPIPSRGFYTGEETNYIVPDAYIEVIGNEIYIIMNDSITPKLSINSIYNSILSESEDKDAKEYVKKKIGSAEFLIKSINMRRTTMYKVIQKIVDIQREYFVKGDTYLKAMSLKDVAEGIEMHESTVSRSIKDKYIYTKNGVIKIKSLFTTAAVGSKKEDLSVNSVKNEIKEIIEKEDNTKPVSDQALSELLKEKGFKISRRTVTKYREQMGIKPSTMRKRF
ncbi:MAG: RNA polymerase factor sigma-54 [Clostridium sp.]|nr:RNA polymerase factor sigma-54 [Clostridium sp.]